ncbi:leucine rich adaptor protein 1 [Salvelinus namaycush]|uniref:Leucine rich adaptor protein 1 n=1 Tax=Salvelinus namaycush TaxID=8040 RepID=A0A8U0R428_SALNM|nr:leucine rich adaptor protein 1 [Salvelinus namaycush]
MDEGTVSNDSIPDLKDLEVKIGRKTPEGLLKWMREEASTQRGDAKLNSLETKDGDITERKSLDEKIRKLKVDMAHLRSVDVKILQQLLAVHEGIEACKWLLEERGTLASRCSSLTSSQYSLGEGPGGDTSWRDSWSSLQDPLNDKLDNISIGSYLDTLADDMDEYCPSSSEYALCSTPLGTEMPTQTGGGTGAGVGAGRGAGAGAVSGAGVLAGTGGAGAELGPGTGGKVVVGPGAPQVKPEIPKEEPPIWTKDKNVVKGTTITKDTKDSNQTQQPSKSNGVLEKAVRQAGGLADSARACLAEKLGKNQSPKLKPYKNGKIDLDGCKMNGTMHLEYDAHWRWVQSQDDVTFL